MKGIFLSLFAFAVSVGFAQTAPSVSVVRLCAFGPCVNAPVIVHITSTNLAVKGFEVTYVYTDGFGNARSLMKAVVARPFRNPGVPSVYSVFTLSGEEADLVRTPTAKSLIYEDPT